MRAIAVTIAFLSLLVAVPASAVDRVVDDNGVACLSGRPLHATIGSAVAAAAPGETILVCPGTYTESVTVDKANLTIQGFDISGYGACGVMALANRTEIVDNRAHDNLSGICLTAGTQHRVRRNVTERNTEGITTVNATGDVTNNTTKDNAAHGIVLGELCSEPVTVDHNQVLGNGLVGILVAACDGTIVTNNTVHGGVGNSVGIFVFESRDALVKLNLVQDAGTGIQLIQVRNSTVTFNSVSANGTGISALGTDATTVTRNNASGDFALDCGWDGDGTNVLTKNNCGTRQPAGAFD